MIVDEVSNAIELATRAHYGQVDKQGKPYIFHCIRVMLKFDDKDSQIVSVFHDSLEDTELTVDDLVDAGFSNYVITAIQALTKSKNENYPDYLERVKQNPLAKKIKLADIDDNYNRLQGLWNLGLKDDYYSLKKKYNYAKDYLNRR